MIDILVINLNNIALTKDVIDDLYRQDYKDFKITVVDNGSDEEGTDNFLDSLDGATVIRNDNNEPINHIWNTFAEQSDGEYLCLLNNDVRLSPNYLSSSVEVFKKDKSIAVVNHTTNLTAYSQWSEKLSYVKIYKCYRQGWDIFIKKERYHHIPDEMLFYFGDDYLYSMIYDDGFYGAYVLNSPLIHYCSKTVPGKGGKTYQQDGLYDTKAYYLLPLKHRTNQEFITDYSTYLPQFNTLSFKNN